jgi:hypothetical protein
VVAVRARTLAGLLLATLLLAACGGGGGARSTTPTPAAGAASTQATDPDAAGGGAGFPVLATRNTTRVAGADPAADAAAVALAGYPSRGADTRPKAVSLVDGANWQMAISAAQLAAAPVGAPVLLASAGALPPPTSQALSQLQPTGLRQAGAAQVVRIGTTPGTDGFQERVVGGTDPAAVAVAVDRLHTALTGAPSDAVVVASSEQPAYAMPAAGWAAKSGDAVLWTDRDTLPAVTRAALRARKKPRIYVLGPASVVSDAVLAQLDRLGTATRIGGEDPVANAIAFARFADKGFGWGVVDPGHGLVFASAQRPVDAAAAALLSGTGTFGPLLLVTEANALPAALQSYLLDIQPGYEDDPVRGVYNHGWLIGSEAAISVDVQARIDTLLQIEPVKASG